MKLVNNTAISATLMTAEKPDSDIRRVYGVAKATFVADDSGEVALETRMPLPIYNGDLSTRFGILPKDDVPRLDPAFEVMVLGRAIAPNGNAVQQMDVELQVGTEHRRIRVFGDRCWKRNGDSWLRSAATPFTEMDLTWQKAFGGTIEAEIDEESFVDVADPVNPLGIGFNHAAQIQQLAQFLDAPDTFPKYNTQQALPNLEDPSSLIQSPEETPVPICWAPCDASSGVLLERLRQESEKQGIAAENMHEVLKFDAPLLLHRAHPDWIIPVPVKGADVQLYGMTEPGKWGFSLPELQVIMDVYVGAHERPIDLYPSGLILMPDIRKFTLVYRGAVDYRYREHEIRTARLRTEKSWRTAARGRAQ